MTHTHTHLHLRTNQHTNNNLTTSRFLELEGTQRTGGNPCGHVVNIQNSTQTVI